MDNPNRDAQLAAAQRIVADAIAKMRVRGLDEFYEEAPGLVEAVISHAVEAAEALVDIRDPMTSGKMQGLSALDEFTAIELAYGEAMFLIGIEYARRRLIGGL